jgi:hypothetical protein
MVGKAARMSTRGAQGLSETDWERLLTRIRDGRCTPFLGSEAVELRERTEDDPQFDALLRWLRKRKPELSPKDKQACFGKVPSSSLLARVLAECYHYPWIGEDDLARVTQFVATRRGWDVPRGDIIDILRRVEPPDFTRPDEPHAVLAALELPVYITTTYYDFMTRALRSRRKKPVTERCRWHPRDREDPSAITPQYNPEPSQPLVYHLYGQVSAERSLVLTEGDYERYDYERSLVLTEDDYLDFLMNTSEDPDLIPPVVRRALSSTTLLFLGYHVGDLEFRTLLRRLAAWPYFMNNERKPHLSVQIVAVGGGPAKPRAYSGFDPRLMSWGDGSGVPTTDKKLVILGIDNNGLLHIRIFDASGNLVTDTDESKVPRTRAREVSILKQQVPGFSAPHVLTGEEKALLISEVTSIVGHPPYSTLEYLKDYCGELKISVHPGTSRQFIEELKDRWEHF